ncbi:CHRNA3 [Mytilus edulis]|uniref:CHRNA3 n=1 Tax=Mytilus edulis TaxID=6550 RepID=A0A8S3PW07_MYTED|nr:CHRNA3 [Mytilus edulis]
MENIRVMAVNYILIALLIVPVISQVPPGAPVITGPQVIVKGDSVTLTCTVTGGAPTPTVNWLRDSVVIDSTSITSGNTVTNTYSFTASDAEHLAVYECQSENGVLQNPLSRTKFVEVYRSPTPPRLTGPTSVVPGTSTTWTCTSEGGYPIQTMTMRKGNTQFSSSQFTTTTQFVTSSQSYTVVGTLRFPPTTADDGQILYCDVLHAETSSTPQTVSLPLSVRSPLSVTAPRTFYNPDETETVTLACVVTNGNPTQIRWYKSTQQLTVIGRYSGSTTSSPSLTISGVVMSDAGTYVCEATDGSATVRTNNIQLSPIERSATEYDIITTVLNGYNRLVRPIDPVNNVTHSLIPKETIVFNPKTLEFKAMQCVSWNDARLSWPRGQPRISLPSSVIWLPDIVMLGQEIDHDFEAKAIIMKNGDVTYCPQNEIKSTNCEEKSGSVWECNFKFLSWSYDKVMLDIHFPSVLTRPSIDMSIYYEHDEYEIVSQCAVRREMSYPCRVGTYPELTYTFVIRRRRSFCRNLNASPTCN